MTGEVFLGNVQGCPRGEACVTCGSTMDLAVETATTQAGVFCFTRCEDCFDDEKMPKLSLPAAVDLSAAHCRHLGIDADQMAAAMEREGASP